jgi:hypothetical protein
MMSQKDWEVEQNMWHRFANKARAVLRTLETEPYSWRRSMNVERHRARLATATRQIDKIDRILEAERRED